VTPIGRGECGSRGRGCHPRSRAAPGQNARPARRPACGLITPAALGRPGVGNAHPYLVPSQEARELELSGGVRSLPQVPWWNAGRRARPKRKGGASRLLRGAPCAPLAYRSWTTRLPAFRFPYFICRKRAAKSCSATARSGPLWIEGSPIPKAGEANKIRCLTSLAAGVRRETGIVLHPPPRKRGRGTTLRSRVVEGASDSTLRFRCRRSVESRAPPTAFGGPPSPLARGGK
jgi:hypothetical protein